MKYNSRINQGSNFTLADSYGPCDIIPEFYNTYIKCDNLIIGIFLKARFFLHQLTGSNAKKGLQLL